LLPAGSALACGVTCFTASTCASRAVWEFIENRCFAFGRCHFGGDGMASNERPAISRAIVAVRVIPPSGDVLYRTAEAPVQPPQDGDAATNATHAGPSPEIVRPKGCVVVNALGRTNTGSVLIRVL
jgi:hypothetical protein